MLDRADLFVLTSPRKANTRRLQDDLDECDLPRPLRQKKRPIDTAQQNQTLNAPRNSSRSRHEALVFIHLARQDLRGCTGNEAFNVLPPSLKGGTLLISEVMALVDPDNAGKAPATMVQHLFDHRQLYAEPGRTTRHRSA